MNRRDAQEPESCSGEAVELPAACAPARVALLSPPGRGALAVVGVDGPDAIAVVSRVFEPHGRRPLAGRADGAICVGRWTAGGEELVVVRRGEASVEIHCHGGAAAAEAVITSLEAGDAVRQPWPVWLVAGGAGPIEVEAREALPRVGGPKAARILSRQLAGVLDAEIERVWSLHAGPRANGQTRALAAAAAGRLRRAARIGLRLVRPWRVVVAGAANAGKSSLVNALAGSARSIVSAEPGTTRDLLETRIVLAGWEIDLIDTAGLRSVAGAGPAGEAEREGIRRAVDAAVDADLVLWVADCRRPDPCPFTAGEPAIVEVFSKVDRGDPGADVTASAVRTSSLTGEGIEALAARIVRTLVPEEEDDPALLLGPVPFTQRQVALIESMTDGAAQHRRP
ncbi:MAG: GTP-binding protein [Planctomycetia bacterium]|nr:GTP-binding protein [Planctomycetia bacterium]